MNFFSLSKAFTSSDLGPSLAEIEQVFLLLHGPPEETHHPRNPCFSSETLRIFPPKQPEPQKSRVVLVIVVSFFCGPGIISLGWFLKSTNSLKHQAHLQSQLYLPHLLQTSDKCMHKLIDGDSGAVLETHGNPLKQVTLTHIRLPTDMKQQHHEKHHWEEPAFKRDQTNSLA